MNGQVAKKLRRAVGYDPNEGNPKLKRMYNILKDIYKDIPWNERHEFLEDLR